MDELDYWTAAPYLLRLARDQRRPVGRSSASGIMVNVRGLPTSGVTGVDVYTLELGGVTGDVTIWTTPGGFTGKLDTMQAWTQHYKQVHAREHGAGGRTRATVRLERPFYIASGATVGLYVHTTGWGGMSVRGKLSEPCRHLAQPSIVELTPARGLYTFSNKHLEVEAGCAKTWSPAPFGEVRRWELNRHLNGIIIYRPRWMIWTPMLHRTFPQKHREAADGLRIYLGASSMGLPRWAVERVLEFCHAEWFNPIAHLAHDNGCREKALT